jgi:hypothetical protein
MGHLALLVIHKRSPMLMPHPHFAFTNNGLKDRL